MNAQLISISPASTTGDNCRYVNGRQTPKALLGVGFFLSVAGTAFSFREPVFPVVPVAITPPPRSHVTAQEQKEMRSQFRRLAKQWRDETIFLSSLDDIVMHPAYQKIISMGASAVPLILKELQKQTNHWFWALREITGEDPVSPQDAGKIKKIAALWIGWGKQKGLI